MTRLETQAPAKINLTLSVLTRRTDGYHELSSLVAFAAVGDVLALEPGTVLDLAVRGPRAAAAGATEDNLVLRAARAARERIEGLTLGRFALMKQLPTGAGLGGGSADAAAALRLIAKANDLATNDARMLDAARAVGADVPVCLDPQARLMHGIGDILSSPIALPRLDAVLVFPDIQLATADVFGSFTLAAGARRKTRYSEAEIPLERAALMKFLASEANDLELAARLVAPAISGARDLLERTGQPRLVRMSGSGSAMFAIHGHARAAAKAAATISRKKKNWWVVATTVG